MNDIVYFLLSKHYQKYLLLQKSVFHVVNNRNIKTVYYFDFVQAIWEYKSQLVHNPVFEGPAVEICKEDWQKVSSCCYFSPPYINAQLSKT